MAFDITPYIDKKPSEVRELIRQGVIDFPTAGMCRGYAQANLVILPPEYADDFEEYTKKNPFPCPVLEIIRGTPETHAMGEGGNIVTDIPRYRVYENGVFTKELTDASDYWKDGYVGFLIGCSFSFEEALMAAGIPVRHIEMGCNVPMYKTNIQTVKAGPFEGPMVCSMRPMTPEERETVRMSKRRLLDGMIGYCRTTDCLHVYMTRYFGENTPRTGTCTGGCTNCDSTFETLDVTDIARSISRCVHDAMYDYDDQGRPTCGPVRQGLGSGKIVAILRGSKAKDLIARHLDRCPSYGRLHDAPEARIRDVLSQMATDGFLSIAEGRLPIVGFGQRAAETVAPEFRYEIKRVERKAAGAGTGVTSRADSSSKSAASDGPALGSYAPDDENETLFQKLRELRLSIARENSLPPYMVFNDRTLRDMARLRPITDAQFLAVNGVGDSKLAKYGKRFMEAIAGFDD